MEKEQVEFDKWGYRKEDYRKFNPKNYYFPPANEEQLEKTLQKIESHMDDFKYKEDIPRLSGASFRIHYGTTRFESLFLVSGVFAWIATFSTKNLIFYKFQSKYRKRMLFFGYWAAFYGTSVLFLSTSDEYSQPQNWGIYEAFPFEKKMQNLHDLKYNIFKDVEKIKYEDKAVSTWQYLTILNNKNKERFKLRKEIWGELGL